MTQPVWSCNEWDPLKEIIIGTSIGANIPQYDLSHHATNYANLTSEQYNKMTFDEAFSDKLNELMELCLKNKLFSEDE